MAHMCSICHPAGREWTDEERKAHVDPREDGTCCYGCGCGWWRELPEEDRAAAEAFTREASRRRTHKS